MPTAADNLVTTLTNACARLAELDAVPLPQRQKMTYTSGGRTVGWNEYRASLVAEIDRLTELVGKVRTITQGPFTVATGVVRG